MTNRIRLRPLDVAAAGLIFMLFFPAFAAAQAGSLAGTIVDEEGNPVEGVEVTITPDASLSSRPRELTTDEEGDFLVAGLTPGRYTVSYAKEGFEPATQQVQIGIAERNRLGDIVLPRQAEGAVAPEAQEHFNAGVEATDAGDFQKAVDSFLMAVEMAPDIPQVHYNLGFAYEKLGEMEKAMEQYEQALELKPDYYEPLMPLSDYHTKNGNWSRAAEYLKRATELRPNDLTAQYNYGAVSMNAGNMDVAKAAFEKVLELDPGRAMAHYQLGMIAVGETRNDDAIVHLEKYLELEPEGAQAPAARGIIQTLRPQQ